MRNWDTESSLQAADSKKNRFKLHSKNSGPALPSSRLYRKSLGLNIGRNSRRISRGTPDRTLTTCRSVSGGHILDGRPHPLNANDCSLVFVTQDRVQFRAEES